MIPFVVSRKPADFDQFMKIWKWCEAAFGKPDCSITWDGDFADHTDDWVRFKFYKDEMASAFVFQWGDYCLTKDEQYKLGMISLQEM